jgi:hypothetical protein
MSNGGLKRIGPPIVGFQNCGQLNVTSMTARPCTRCAAGLNCSNGKTDGIMQAVPK